MCIDRYMQRKRARQRDFADSMMNTSYYRLCIKGHVQIQFFPPAIKRCGYAGHIATEL